MEVIVTQWYLTLCNLMDCSPPCSSVHGILQARILEWVPIPFSRGSSQLRDLAWVSCIAGRIFTIRDTGKPSLTPKFVFFPLYSFAYRERAGRRAQVALKEDTKMIY